MCRLGGPMQILWGHLSPAWRWVLSPGGWGHRLCVQGWWVRTCLQTGPWRMAAPTCRKEHRVKFKGPDEWLRQHFTYL